MGKVVIWGLKTELHSHKFIQGAFYQNFKQMGFDVAWVDDTEKNSQCINKYDIVFAVDVASKFLPVVRGAYYVLHNISPQDLGLEDKYISLQVHTKKATGESLGIPYVHWDRELKTLFQPWGVPTMSKDWKAAKNFESHKEYWVGSIWNNDLNQGNSEFMEGYKSSIENYGIQFVRKGTPTRFQPNGISEFRSMKLVNRSAIGAAVVGEWQRVNEYVPCRLFKNIASGAVPSSNANFSALFGTDGGVFMEEPESLISSVLSLNSSEKSELVNQAQNTILPFTYHAAINRILTLLLS
jgi:hypothetical protein